MSLVQPARRSTNREQLSNTAFENQSFPFVTRRRQFSYSPPGSYFGLFVRWVLPLILHFLEDQVQGF